MMNYKFCTLFDKNYLSHALSLCDSLEKNVSSFVIYCFCMDDESFKYIQGLRKDTIVPVSYKQLEIKYLDLQAAKLNRSIVEYYFTCSSAICSYIFNCYQEIDLITYLDADLYFFSSPESIFLELEDASVGIIEHRFSLFGKKYEKYGKYNVGWVSFRNDLQGRKCLEDWRKDCIKWCYDRLEDGKFGDQKYLDYWTDKYEGVHTIQHIGANLAPWNVGRYQLKINSKTNQILVNDKILIFYHFASFKQVTINSYITYVSQYLVPLTGVLRNNIYLHYLSSIQKHNTIIGIEFNIKNRNGYAKSGLEKRIRHYSRKFKQFVFRDNIEID